MKTFKSFLCLISLASLPLLLACTRDRPEAEPTGEIGAEAPAPTEEESVISSQDFETGEASQWEKAPAADENPPEEGETDRP